jgi:hypothetical protein
MMLRFSWVPARRFTTTQSTAFSRLRWVVVPLVVGALAGCQDDPADPLAALVSAEIAPAVAVPVDLPSLGELAQLAGVREELGPVLDGWVAGWEDENPALGRAARDEAIRLAAPVLHDALGPGGIATTLAPLFQVGRDLGEIDDVPADLAPRLEEVRSFVDDTRVALDEGRYDRALTLGLQASDRIRALGPRAVARTLISRADRALIRAQIIDGFDPVSLSRGERLLSGARRAMDEGQVDLAIQRGYYAVQVLEGRGDEGG